MKLSEMVAGNTQKPIKLSEMIAKTMFDPETSDPSLQYRAKNPIIPSLPEVYSPEGGAIGSIGGGEKLWQKGDAPKIAMQAAQVPYNLGFRGGPETDFVVPDTPAPSFTKEDMHKFQESMKPASPIGKGLGFGAEMAALLPFFALSEGAVGAPMAAKIAPKFGAKVAPYASSFLKGFGSGAPVETALRLGEGESLPQALKQGAITGGVFGGANVAFRGAGELLKGMFKPKVAPKIELPSPVAEKQPMQLTQTPKKYGLAENEQTALSRLNEGIEDVQNFLQHNDILAAYPPGTRIESALADIKAKTGIDLPKLVADVEAVQAKGGLRTQAAQEASFAKLGQAAGAIPEVKGLKRGGLVRELGAQKMPELPRVEPLPEGVGAMKYHYDTKQSIKSAAELKGPFNAVEKAKKGYSKTVDSVRVFNDFDEYVKKTTGKSLSADKDLYTAATNTRSSEGMAARTMEENMVDFEGNAVAPSLKSIIDRVSKTVGGEDNWKAAEDYFKLRHSMYWMKKGRNVYEREAGLDVRVGEIKKLVGQMERTKDAGAKAQLQAQIDTIASSIEGRFVNPRLAAYEAKHPEIAQAAREYMDWINKLGEEWGVKTGLIKPKEWAALRAEYPDYVPLQRVMETVEKGGMGTGAGFVNQPSPIKRGKGSERDTLESLEVMIERIPQLINEAKKNAVGQNFVELIKKHPQEMVDAFGAKIVKVKPGEAVKPNVVKVRVGGEEVFVEMTDPALLEGMRNLTKAGQDVITETVRKATSMMKTLTTGVNPFFALIRNPLYDTPAAYTYSKTLSKKFGINNPVEFTVDLVDSYIRILTNEKWNKVKYLQMYRNMGGGSFTSASADRNVLSEAKSRILPGYLNVKKPVQSAGRLGKMGYEGLQRLMSATETGPRLPEFIRTIKKGGDTYAHRQKGLYEANDITYNYSRSGEVSKFVDAYFPYFNAAVQGIDKFARVARENPVGLIANSIVAVTGFEMGLYMLNRDNPNYQRLSEATKARYYCIPKPDGTFVKLVKPREIGVVFGTALVDALDYMKTHDPKVFESLKVGFKNSFIPTTRSIYAPIGDLRANKDFADRAIVPAYMQDQSPGTQADIKTSMPAKWLGGKLNISPKQIDYVVGAYGGIVTQLGLPAMAEGGGIKEVLNRQYIADPAYSNDTITRFYKAKDKIDMASTDAKIDGQGLVGDDEKLRKLYSKAADIISDARTQIRAVENDRTLDAESKKAILRGMQMGIIEVAEVANKPLDEQLAMYDQLKRKGFIVETKQKTDAQTKKATVTEQKKYSTMSGILTK